MNAAHNWTMPVTGLGTFDGELSTSAPEAAAKNARTAKRVPVELDAGLRQRGAAAISVHIRDLSTHGFRVETHLGLAIGTPVWLRLPGLEASLAHVMWADGYLVGCAFDRPLHPAVLELIVRRSGGR